MKEKNLFTKIPKAANARCLATSCLQISEHRRKIFVMFFTLKVFAAKV